MMRLKNKIKKILISSKIIPEMYTFLTKPFEKKLRHLEKENLPKSFKKISAIVPNYNYSNFLPRRIESVLTQSYPVSELIILDDASTDKSDETIKKLLEKYKKVFPNIKFAYKRNDKNTGKPIIQWKKAFSLASGDFIWICEADDYCDCDFLASIMSVFEKDKNIILGYSNSVAVNSKNHVLSYDFAMHSGELDNAHWKTSYIENGETEVEKYLKHRCTIPNVSAVVFRNIRAVPFTKYLEEAEKFSQVGDWYFYLKILSHGKIAFKKSSRNFFRISNNSVTGKSKNSKKLSEEIEWIHKHFKS